MNAPSGHVISLAEHQLGLCEEADKIVGFSLQLRSALRSASPSIPLPDAETDNLVHALAAFIAAAGRYEPGG